MRLEGCGGLTGLVIVNRCRGRLRGIDKARRMLRVDRRFEVVLLPCDLLYEKFEGDRYKSSDLQVSVDDSEYSSHQSL